MTHPSLHLILGMGASGRAAAGLLLDEGCRVAALDRESSAREHPEALRLAARGLRWLEPEVELASMDFVQAVVSPGIPADSWIASLARRGVPCISELELGWSRRGASRVLAITGSNGKSTAAKWCAEALALAGFAVGLGGNYGTPVCELVRQVPASDWLVLEVSSFQLETVREFNPEVGVLLNVHPNHLDRHGTVECYRRTKARLFARSRPEDAAIVPAELRELLAAESGGRPTWRTFGSEPGRDAWYADGRIGRTGRGAINLRGTYYGNPVLGISAAAVWLALEACGLGDDAILNALRRLEPLPHRMARVASIRGVDYIDDSKATSLAAVSAALRMVDRPVRLIAGGRLKESELSSLKELLVERVKTVYLIGESAERMADQWGAAVPCVLARTMQVAVEQAVGDAGEGEVVLLSPGCASFDQYDNYARRGDHFAALVRTTGEASA